MPRVLQRQDVPTSIRSLTPMEPDYVDLFTISSSGASDASAEEWAQAGLDQAAGLAGQFVWRVVLGLRLGSRRSQSHIGGWTIADRGKGWVRLEAASWCMTAHLVVFVEDDRVSAATFVHYDRPIAAVVWSRLAPVHRRAMPGLLRRAVRVREKARR